MATLRNQNNALLFCVCPFPLTSTQASLVLGFLVILCYTRRDVFPHSGRRSRTPSQTRIICPSLRPAGPTPFLTAHFECHHPTKRHVQGTDSSTPLFRTHVPSKSDLLGLNKEPMITVFHPKQRPSPQYNRLTVPVDPPLRRQSSPSDPGPDFYPQTSSTFPGRPSRGPPCPRPAQPPLANRTFQPHRTQHTSRCIPRSPPSSPFLYLDPKGVFPALGLFFACCAMGPLSFLLRGAVAFFVPSLSPPLNSYSVIRFAWVSPVALFWPFLTRV